MHLISGIINIVWGLFIMFQPPFELERELLWGASWAMSIGINITYMSSLVVTFRNTHLTLRSCLLRRFDEDGEDCALHDGGGSRSLGRAPRLRPGSDARLRWHVCFLGLQHTEDNQRNLHIQGHHSSHLRPWATNSVLQLRLQEQGEEP